MARDCPNCKVYREVIREQGAFIYKIKHEIRDFLKHPPVTLGRSIADRGFRST